MKRSYIVKQIILITYNGDKIPFEITNSEIINRPIKSLKESIIDQFSNMEDKPIKVDLKIEYV